MTYISSINHPAFGAERSSIQNPIVRYAQEVGWKYLSPDEALTQRGGEGGLLLQETFLSQVQRLNPEIIDWGAMTHDRR